MTYREDFGCSDDCSNPDCINRLVVEDSVLITMLTQTTKATDERTRHGGFYVIGPRVGWPFTFYVGSEPGRPGGTIETGVVRSWRSLEGGAIEFDTDFTRYRLEPAPKG